MVCARRDDVYADLTRTSRRCPRRPGRDDTNPRHHRPHEIDRPRGISFTEVVLVGSQIRVEGSRGDTDDESESITSRGEQFRGIRVARFVGVVLGGN